MWMRNFSCIPFPWAFGLLPQLVHWFQTGKDSIINHSGCLCSYIWELVQAMLNLSFLHLNSIFVPVSFCVLSGKRLKSTLLLLFFANSPKRALARFRMPLCERPVFPSRSKGNQFQMGWMIGRPLCRNEMEWRQMKLVLKREVTSREIAGAKIGTAPLSRFGRTLKSRDGPRRTRRTRKPLKSSQNRRNQLPLGRRGAKYRDNLKYDHTTGTLHLRFNLSFLSIILPSINNTRFCLVSEALLPGDLRLF